MELRRDISSSVPQFSKVFKATLACLLLAALAWAGGDPWKSKPYQQWDANDVKKVFSDSPWSKVVQISATWKPAQSSEGSAPAEPQSSGGSAKTGGIGGSASSSQASAPSPTGGAPVATNAEASYAVRWISSRTIREAGYRNSVIEGRLKEDEAEKQLALPVDTYEVYLGGPDMTPFQSMDDKTAQGAATLTEKKTKQHISATKAQLVHSEDGKTLQGIVFSFPKQAGNGEPSISPNEKSVEFTCAAGKAKIQTTFDLSKMEDSKGRDI
ncbi:MAG: hypothetical protein WAL95_02940 [Candidatus Acidiferrales bacterium]